MALKGIRIIEMAGLAPVPFCGMILADFGASVIRVDRTQSGMGADTLARGKRSISVNLKDPKGQEVIQRLTSQADVLIEPFRPGVMEKLNLGPEKLMSKNPRLVYARLSGYGQTGTYVKKAGHDINYVAMSGVLSRLGRKGEKPFPPINLLADFAGGGLTCAFGILLSLLERQTSGKGQIVDTSMVEGAAYVSSFLFKSQLLPIWGKGRGENWLDSGAPFYDTYKTKDGHYMAVGSLEPQFYEQLMQGLELTSEEQYLEQFSDFDKNKEIISKKFASKTRDEWTEIFDKLDACVTPVLDLDEAPSNPLNKSREAFGYNKFTDRWDPQPAPKLSRTPGRADLSTKEPDIGEHTIDIMKEIGYDQQKIEEFITSGSVGFPELKSKL